MGKALAPNECQEIHNIWWSFFEAANFDSVIYTYISSKTNEHVTN
ncbi:hypothetical protein FORMB_11490 [Formosa sp. Hel1_33_131]|nr:hypothetical protein FORMB_11490 [Formosa sp. Hel1_33_131]